MSKIKTFLLKFYNKIKKSLLIISLTLAGLQVFGIFKDYMYGKYSIYPPADLSLASFVNSVLGIPDLDKGMIIDDSYNNLVKTNTDITKFSREEWYGFKCKIRLLDKIAGAPLMGNFDKNIYDKDKAHIHCLEMSHSVPYHGVIPNSIESKVCTNYLNCQILTLTAREYVLEHPEILWNIVKIAEKPCDYIKNVEESDNDEIKRGIKDLRKRLHCDGFRYPWYMKERVYIVITIIDPDPDSEFRKAKRTMDIIVRRKDID